MKTQGTVKRGAVGLIKQLIQNMTLITCQGMVVQRISQPRRCRCRKKDGNHISIRYLDIFPFLSFRAIGPHSPCSRFGSLDWLDEP